MDRRRDVEDRHVEGDDHPADDNAKEGDEQRLDERGEGRGLGLDLVVFVMIRTRHHSKEWIDAFRAHVERLPQVIDFYRIGGDWDYLIKVVTRGMSGYDAFYQKLITNFDLSTVTGFFSMEAIIDNRPVDLGQLR